MVTNRKDNSLRRMGLFVEGIGGQGNGTHKVQDEVSFVSVSVGVSPNGRIVAENGDAVREWVEVNVNESGTNEPNCSVNVGDGDGDGLRRCD